MKEVQTVINDNTLSMDELFAAIAKIQEQSSEKRMIGIKVTSKVFEVIKANYLCDNTTWSMTNYVNGLHIEIDENAKYPFTPVYNKE